MHSTKTVKFRPIQAVTEKLTADHGAQMILSAFVQVAVEQSIGGALHSHTEPVLCARHASRPGVKSFEVALPGYLVPHFERWAQASGVQTVGELISSALAALYLGAVPGARVDDSGALVRDRALLEQHRFETA